MTSKKKSHVVYQMSGMECVVVIPRNVLFLTKSGDVYTSVHGYNNVHKHIVAFYVNGSS